MLLKYKEVTRLLIKLKWAVLKLLMTFKKYRLYCPAFTTYQNLEYEKPDNMKHTNFIYSQVPITEKLTVPSFVSISIGN